MKVFELMNQLANFKGGEECFLLDDGSLAIAGKPAFGLPRGGVDLQPPAVEDVQFASKAAGAAAAEVDLQPPDFEGFEPSSPNGFTVKDVVELAKALEKTDGG